MKIPVSSGETQKQKHDAVHVFIYGLSPQHIETCHLSVSDGDGRKGPNRMWLWETLIMVHSRTQDVFQLDGTRGMKLAVKYLTRDNWICDVFDFIFHISVNTSTAATSALAISILTWRIIITVFPTCSILKQRRLATSKVQNIHKRIEILFVPIMGESAKVRVPQRKQQTRDWALSCDTFMGCGAGGRCLRLIRLEKWSAHPLRK